MENTDDFELASENLELKELYEQVKTRSDRAFSNLSSFHDECRANLKALHSWENRRSYTYHNNVDVPLFYKVVESLVPYESSGTLEPGCTALHPEDVEAATSMNQQLKYFNNTREAKRARSEAVLWKILCGIGFLKDGWNFKQDRHRRWVKDDEELVYLASESEDKTLKELAASIQDMGPDTPPEELEQHNEEVVNAIKEYLRQPGENGEPICPSITPSGDGFIIYDIDQYDAPALEAIPTYDIAWLGTGHDIQKYEAIYHRYYLSKTQLANIIRDSKSNKSSGWVNLDYVYKYVDLGNTESEVISQDWDKTLPEAASFEFIEETRRDEDGEIVVTTICPKGECVVRHMKSPFFHNQFNYTPLVMNQSVSDIRGTSVFRPIESLCMAIEKQLNSLLDNSDIIQNPAFRVSKGSMMTDRQLSLYAGKIIPARQGDLEPIVIPDIRSATVEIINYLISMIYSITGCPEVLDSVIPMMGNGNGRADLEELKFSTTARLRASLNADSIALSGLMERECSNIMQFCRYPRKIPFTNNGKTEYIDYVPNLTSGSFKFMTDASTMLAPDPSVLRAQLTSLINMAPGLVVAHLDEESGQLVQRQLLNIRSILRMWAEYSNVGDTEQFFVPTDSVEAIPAQALPPVPQPPPPEEEPPQDGQQPPPGGGGAPPQGGAPGGMPQHPDPAAILSQVPPEVFAQIFSQPDSLQMMVQQGTIPPEVAQILAEFVQAVMQDPSVLEQLVQQGVIMPQVAQTIMAVLSQMNSAQQPLMPQGAPSPYGGAVPGSLPLPGSATPAPMGPSILSSAQQVGPSMVPGSASPAPGAAPPPSPLPSEQELQQMVQMILQYPPEISLKAMLQLPPEVIAMLLPYLPPEFVQWFLSQIPPDLAAYLSNPSGQIRMDGGLSISPEQALAMGGGATPPSGGGGGMNTATGTNGMPPQLGGTQQAGAHPVVSPNQVSVKSRTSDVRQSANTIQQ